MPSQPLPRFLETHASRVEHARKLEKIVREVGGNVADEKSRHWQRAADRQTLRGVPCVGPGVAGVMPNTNPVYALMAKQPDDD